MKMSHKKKLGQKLKYHMNYKNVVPNLILGQNQRKMKRNFPKCCINYKQ